MESTQSSNMQALTGSTYNGQQLIMTVSYEPNFKTLSLSLFLVLLSTNNRRCYQHADIGVVTVYFHAAWEYNPPTHALYTLMKTMTIDQTYYRNYRYTQLLVY